MKKLDYNKILGRANTFYAVAKAEKGLDIKYTAPEAMPQIQSDQVKSAIKAIVEELNVILGEIDKRKTSRN